MEGPLPVIQEGISVHVALFYIQAIALPVPDGVRGIPT